MTSLRGGKQSKKVSQERSCHLFSAWADNVAQLRRAKHVALLLDFDGTLVELRSRPDQVRLPQPVHQALARLARCSRVSVAIISGRTLEDVRGKVGLSGVQYLGLHGWERENREANLSRRILREIKRVKAAARAMLRGFPGIWLEDKKFGFVVHYDGAGRTVVQRASGAFRRELKPFLSEFCVLRGKKVWEVLPRTIPGKGVAVKLLLKELPKSALPIYIGDDVTDESAFRALRRGITVHVGRPNRTEAHFWLRNPDEVFRFLEMLEKELRCRQLSHSVSSRPHT